MVDGGKGVMCSHPGFEWVLYHYSWCRVGHPVRLTDTLILGVQSGLYSNKMFILE